MPAYLKQRLESAATKHGRSVTQEIIQRLEHTFTPWQERPWEERMVIDVDRAMLRLLTKDEYKLLLDRVKNAGGADAVNGYAPKMIQSDEDLQYPIPDGPRLTDRKDMSFHAAPDKDAIATQLALKVLEVLGSDRDRAQAKQWKDQIDAQRTAEGKAPLSDVLDQEAAESPAKESNEPKRRFIKRNRGNVVDKEKGK